MPHKTKKKPPLSPCLDFVFKLIFGDSRNIGLLAAFLKTVLDLADDELDHLTIMNPFLKPEFPNDKACVLDVKVHTVTGKIIDVEIQFAEYYYMRERVACYSSKMITEQIGSGQDYSVIKPAICIIITDYILVPEDTNCRHHFLTHDPETNVTLYHLTDIYTLELPKYLKTNAKTPLGNWLQFLQAKTWEDLHMVAMTNPEINKAVGVLMKLSEDEATRQQAESRERFLMDQRVQQKAQHELGVAEGENRSFKLMALLDADGRSDDAKRCYTDSSFREQLYQEYHL
jgi:predicted transposase/invertase (TIGR01784 family)